MCSVAAGEDVNTARFRPDKGFSGVDYGAAGGRSGGPVQFEKDAGEADPFGLDQVLRRKNIAMNHIILPHITMTGLTLIHQFSNEFPNVHTKPSEAGQSFMLTNLHNFWRSSTISMGLFSLTFFSYLICKLYTSPSDPHP